MDISDATEFSGISRAELYVLMRSGELPYSVATRERLVPRRCLVQYLVKLTQERSHPGLIVPDTMPAQNGKPKWG
ncbi:MAG: helix-turn-helix domain-containing protein [Planctomycetaceae bacterium]|nr:helix-turn-helix domain-containing protein [Planctomycetaceae bacterium]